MTEQSAAERQGVVQVEVAGVGATGWSAGEKINVVLGSALLLALLGWMGVKGVATL